MEEIVLGSVKEYFDIVEKFKGNYYFRGQADSEWRIEPSIFRNSSYLKEEISLINKSYEKGNGEDIIKEVLRLQHYGKPTRLCDLTINPLVALFFAIDGEDVIGKDGAVFIFDKSEEITLDSLELNILLMLSTTEYKEVSQVVQDINDKLESKIDENLLKDIITSNFIIKYSKELAYSNSRATLQGGTGIFFGFGIDNNNYIIRNGGGDLKSLCRKIIIPASLKNSIIKFLSEYGIKGNLLYDRIAEEKYNTSSINYTVNIDHKAISNSICPKIILDVIIDDILFTKDEIVKIVNEVINKYTKKYGEDKLLCMYVYYDEQDKRNFNWITWGATINYNNSYHIRRMQYMHDEISIFEIRDKTEPIVELCKKKWLLIREYHEQFKKQSISKDEYKCYLEDIYRKIFKPIYYDIQDVYHGGKRFDNYYNSSNMFCIDLISIIEEVLKCLKENDINSINFMYDMKTEICEKSYDNYVESLRELEW